MDMADVRPLSPLPALAEMQEAFDGWCSFSKLCLGHFRCIRPTSFGLYVFNLTSRRVKVWLEDGWELLYLCWQVESGKHGGGGQRRWREGEDGEIERVWKQPYKEKEREVCAADSVQTADKGWWDERKEKKQRKAKHMKGKKWNRETKAKEAFGEETWCGRRENNVIVGVETKRERQERGRTAIFLSQWIGLFNRWLSYC